MPKATCWILMLGALTAGCSDSGRVSTIPETTMKPCVWPPEMDGAMTNGVRVDTVGKDTVVTLVQKGRSRQLAFEGVTGYRGTVAQDAAELVIGDLKVSLRPDHLNVYGPTGGLSVDLAKGPFQGRNLVVRRVDGKLVAIPFSEEPAP